MAVEVDPLAFQKGFSATQGIFDNARQSRLAELAFGQKQQELAQQNALAGVLGNLANYDEAGNLRREALSQIAQASPASVPQYQEMFQQQGAAQAAAQKAKRDQLIAQFDWADKNMAGVQNQAQWDEFRARAAQVYPDVAARLPEKFDPAAIQANRMKIIPEIEKWKAEQENERFRQQQETTRRGQDLSAQTAIRGQDITARGQDMTDARTREANAAKAAADKVPTEFQSKAAIYGARAQEADRILNSLDYSPAALSTKQAASNVPLIGGVLGAGVNLVTPAKNQQAEQAQRDFINAVLRQESGAAISPSEFDNARKQYFPQPGDSKAVIEQKAQNRKTEIEGLQRGAGKAAYSGGGSKPKPSLSDIFGN